MKILIVVDKKKTAIDRLAEFIKKYSNLNLVIIPVHPKRESEENLLRFEELALEADLIHFMYWKTADMLLKRYDFLKDKKKILSHHNPYNIRDIDNKQFDLVTTCNQSIQKDLANDIENQYIKLAVDFDVYDFNDNYDVDSKKVLMVANRIEPKKGIKEVAEVCKELGYPFHLVGAISKMDYFNEILEVGGVTYHQQISDEKLKDLYYSSAIHVCNSIDNFESGTMPILESMACGLPVITRNTGHVPDFSTPQNIVVRYGQPDDKEDLKKEIQMLMDNPDRRQAMRIEAYKTAVYYSAEIMARDYEKLYRRTIYPNHKTVSVIIPTIPENVDNVEKIKEVYNNQSYPNVEIITMVDNAEGYNLAKSRNEAVIKATGEYLIFNDDRMLPEKNTVIDFVSKMRPKTWLYGNKDNAKKKNFVENFSCVNRQEFIDAGMCNERIDEYGGMSQELRSRFIRQGFNFEYQDNVKAKTMKKSSRVKRLKSLRRMKTKLFKMGLYE